MSSILRCPYFRKLLLIYNVQHSSIILIRCCFLSLSKGEVDLPIPRLHVDFPLVLVDSQTFSQNIMT